MRQHVVTARRGGRAGPVCAHLGTPVPPAADEDTVKWTSLADERPVIATEWHPTRNGDRRADRVHTLSPTPAWWLCSTCSRTWAAPVARRTSPGCDQCLRARRVNATWRARRDMQRWWSRHIGTVHGPGLQPRHLTQVGWTIPLLEQAQAVVGHALTGPPSALLIHLSGGRSAGWTDRDDSVAYVSLVHQVTVWAESTGTSAHEALRWLAAHSTPDAPPITLSAYLEWTAWLPGDLAGLAIAAGMTRAEALGQQQAGVLDAEGLAVLASLRGADPLVAA